MRIVKLLLLLTVLTLSMVSAASYMRPSRAASPGKYFDYVVTILMENNDLQGVLSQGTFQASLASQYTLSTGYSGVSHPSEPNYVALLGGDTFISGDGNCCYTVQASNLVDRLESAGINWRAFAEDASGSGTCSFRPPREGDHFAFIVFSDMNTATRCSNFQSTSSSADSEFVSYLNSANPANYIWLTPNDQDNSHSSPISTGDAYLSALVPQILSSSLFRSQRAALFIVYDEGNDASCASGGPDCIYASWSGPAAKKGFSSTRAYTHYSYLHTVEDNWGLQTLTTNDGGASVMSEFFATSGPTPPTPPTPLSTGFTISPSPDQPGQPVTFSATTSGGTSPYDDSWNFGDGSSGTGSTATHAYSSTGTFQVTLTTHDAASPPDTATSTKPITVNQAAVGGSLSISFTSDPPSPAVGQVVTFTSQASGGNPPYGVAWDFGDGAISVGLSTTHTFSGQGTFNVTAAVSDSSSPAGFAATSVFVTIGGGTSPPSSLSAHFSFQPTNPSVGDTVSFTPTVSGGAGPYGYTWNFGDSAGTNSVANPTYSYSTSGTFSITLTVTDSNGGSVSTSQNIVVSSATTPPPSPSPPSATSGQYCSSLAQGAQGDLQPLVPVDYVNPSNSGRFTATALVDTGATYSLAPTSLEASLGLSPAAGTPLTLTGVNGAPIQAEMYHLTLDFGGSLTVANVPVAFTDSTNQFLIGRLGFLDQVSVTFDSTNHTVCLDTGPPSSGGSGGGPTSGTGPECDDDDDDSGCSGDSGSEDFVGVISFASGGVLSGLPVMLTMIPIVALGGVVLTGIFRAPSTMRLVKQRRRRR